MPSPAPMLTAVATALGIAAALATSAEAQLQAPRPQPVQAAPQSRPKAPPKANPLQSDPMKVRIVRSTAPGCEPACAEWISAEGQILPGTPAEFRRVLAKLGTRKLPILIDSPGGSVDHGMAIGRMIRAKGLDVVVTKTAFAPPCEPADKDCRQLKAKGIERGMPEARISKCASSCAFILAGGVRRYVGAWTVVGLHEIRSTQTLRLVRQHYRLEPGGWGAPARKTVVKQETLWSSKVELPTDEKAYDKIRQFFVEMGVSDTIMPILRSAPNSSIRWMRIADLKATGLATDFQNGEQLLSPIPVASTTGAPELARLLPGVQPGSQPAAPTQGCPGQPGMVGPCTATGSIPRPQPPDLRPPERLIGAPSPSANPFVRPHTPLQPQPSAPPTARVEPAPQTGTPTAPTALPAAAATTVSPSSPTPEPVKVASPNAEATPTVAAEPARPKPAPKPRPRPARADKTEPFTFFQQ